MLWWLGAGRRGDPWGRLGPFIVRIKLPGSAHLMLSRRTQEHRSGAAEVAGRGFQKSLRAFLGFQGHPSHSIQFPLRGIAELVLGQGEPAAWCAAHGQRSNWHWAGMVWLLESRGGCAPFWPGAPPPHLKSSSACSGASRSQPPGFSLPIHQDFHRERRAG